MSPQILMLQRNPDEFIYLFEKLIFYGSVEQMEEAELVRHTEKFLNDINQMWPLPEEKTSDPLATSKKRRYLRLG